MELNISKNGSARPADQLRELVGKAEELLVTLGDGGDAAVTDLRQRVKSTLRNAEKKLQQIETQAQDMADRTVRGTNEYVHANPWTSVAMAAAVGALVGALVSRRI
jgi:ElaB/YqjD/DUF883 family membrane-anchored ribosome-binding protein